MSQMPMGSGPMQGQGAPPIGYALAGGVEARDGGHLMALSICHYVFGGMSILFSSIFIFHIVIGAAMLSGKFPMMPPMPVSQAGMPMTQPAMPVNPFPANFDQTMGWLFVIMGSCAVGIGWTVGILAIISGMCIARRRRRTFSLVIAAICCIVMPLGTILGIFTIIVLLRDSVKRVYSEQSV
jgi:hypothetical protein